MNPVAFVMLTSVSDPYTAKNLWSLDSSAQRRPPPVPWLSTVAISCSDSLLKPDTSYCETCVVPSSFAAWSEQIVTTSAMFQRTCSEVVPDGVTACSNSVRVVVGTEEKPNLTSLVSFSMLSREQPASASTHTAADTITPRVVFIFFITRPPSPKWG